MAPTKSWLYHLTKGKKELEECERIRKTWHGWQGSVAELHSHMSYFAAEHPEFGIIGKTDIDFNMD